jgi:hypothetical protein
MLDCVQLQSIGYPQQDMLEKILSEARTYESCNALSRVYMS